MRKVVWNSTACVFPDSHAGDHILETVGPSAKTIGLSMDILCGGPKGYGLRRLDLTV
jgi:hypothetical protein